MPKDIPVTYVLTNDVKRAYMQRRLRIARDIQIFESDGTTPWQPFYAQPRLVGGDISVDGSRDERRTLSNLTLSNKDGKIKHGPNGGLWYDKIIKMYRGIYFRDEFGVEKKFLAQVGEFMIDTIDTDRTPSLVQISGRDYTKKLILDQFDRDTSFAAGIPIDSIVRAVAVNGGISKFRLGAGGVAVGATAAFARGSSRWSNIRTICNASNIEVYFDREGYLVTRPFDDVSTSPGYLTLSDQIGSQNIVDYSQSSSDSNIFNHVVVTGTSEEETVTGYAYISVAVNDDINSPTCVQKIGRRTFNFEVNYLNSQAQADDLAQRLLQVKQLEDFNLSFSTVCLPWLEPYRVLQFMAPNSDSSQPTRYLFTDFSIPATLGPMTGTAKRILIVGSTNSDGLVDSDGNVKLSVAQSKSGVDKTAMGV